MRYFSKIILLAIAILIISTPVVTHALSFNIWDGTEVTSSFRNASGTLTTQTKTCNVAGSCNLCHALRVFQNIVQILFQIAIPLAVILIVYGGIRLMMSGGSEQNVSASKEIIINAIIGLAIALSAWILVNVVITLIATTSISDMDFSLWNKINCI